jgi:hypothetical protein
VADIDRNPTPEGFEARCLHCGKPLPTTKGVTRHVVEPAPGIRSITRFCSEECARDYISSHKDEWEEEFEEIERAGAT